MDTYNIYTKQMFLELHAQEQQQVLKDLEQAITENMLVSVRGQVFNDEYVTLYTVSTKATHDKGELWDYYSPEVLLEIFKG